MKITDMPTYVRVAPYVLAFLGAVVVVAFCYAFDARWFFYGLTGLGAVKGYGDGLAAQDHWHRTMFDIERRREDV